MHRRWALMSHRDLEQFSPLDTSCFSLANMHIICLIRPPRRLNTVPEDTKTLWIMTSAQENRVLFSPCFTDDKTEPWKG